MQRDEHNSYFCTPLQHDEVETISKDRIDISKNPHPTIIIEEIHEPPSLTTGKIEIKIHEGECKLLQGIWSEGEGGVSHENKEKYIVEMEYITEILIGEDCATKEYGVHSLDPTISVIEEQFREIRNTLDIV